MGMFFYGLYVSDFQALFKKQIFHFSF